ncbi:GyrI-like domain-containing protein [Halobacillus yeomjeoni]|uniref:GyrI-like domain-containing protein n=1 Tax=Halobacillus yeomjeoni TaxID=311194 RepID=UPI001CD20B65|nr:GyrI-like domain-containing protein [Halobacillus yeomjeoni]MCA0983242.1 GyrI-like domain-containing protein [Halobacillus yeomjeoni]
MSGIRKMGDKKLVGFRVICASMEGYGQAIPEASMALQRRKDEINQLVEPVKLIGAFKAAETSEQGDGYWVCYEVHEVEEVPEGMVSLVIPANTYAVLNYKGRSSNIHQVYSDLHKWIEEHRYERVPNEWTLEIYTKWTEQEDHVDLCDPVLC